MRVRTRVALYAKERVTRFPRFHVFVRARWHDARASTVPQEFTEICETKRERQFGKDESFRKKKWKLWKWNTQCLIVKLIKNLRAILEESNSGGNTRPTLETSKKNQFQFNGIPSEKQGKRGIDGGGKYLTTRRTKAENSEPLINPRAGRITRSN